MNYHQRQTFTQDSTHVISFIEPDLQLSQVISFFLQIKQLFELKWGYIVTRYICI